MSESTTITPGPSEGDTASMDFRPIADYGLLADCNSAALVDRMGGSRGALRGDEADFDPTTPEARAAWREQQAPAHA